MCWTCNRAVKQIANEDIKVFKVGYFHKNMFCSLYKNFHYRLNKVYSTNIHMVSDGDYKTNGFQGFHSYNPSVLKLNIVSDVRYVPYDIWTITFRGLLIAQSFTDDRYYKAECIIPKGSEYYENDRGEIISNQIVIKNVIPINRL